MAGMTGKHAGMTGRETGVLSSFVCRTAGPFFRLLLKHPLLVERKACDDVHAVGDDVCKEAWLHELQNEIGEGLAPGHVECIDGCFECHEIERVGGKKHDDESDDFGALATLTLEVPDTVHQVAVDGAENEPEKVRKFQVPVQKLMHHPDRG